MAARTGDYPAAMKEFIDHLIGVADWRSGDPSVSSRVYDAAPEPIRNPVLMAHLGGMAEHLAHLSGRPGPDWCEQPAFFLDRPHFQGGRNARPFMVDLTPLAFARRKLFCGPVLEKLHQQLPSFTVAKSKAG
ncbi:hypothetical protein SAE02_72720 [Skermanella aerolata]|uniref:Uncharacterized protein n=1 Tax=Skermanella aerolata TaxID=393310 RepID=A0A512E340_9PROT|nr:hypothetical protein [Skermanella aerolata]KJB90262.1 hypothetical protein N826_38815 [Skermanella aerolata KACC 11604]GEO43124.1 hypothetical protein SAE02_72720 [Skermanella aerolata]